RYFLAGTTGPFVVRAGVNTAGTLGPIRRDPPRPPKGLTMSENDPWKSWYQEPTPSDPPSADRTVSMPQPSNRPTFEPNSGSGGGDGAGGWSSWSRRVGKRTPVAVLGTARSSRAADRAGHRGCDPAPHRRHRGHLLLGQRKAEQDRRPARHNPHLGRDELADRRVRPADR